MQQKECYLCKSAPVNNFFYDAIAPEKFLCETCWEAQLLKKASREKIINIGVLIFHAITGGLFGGLWVTYISSMNISIVLRIVFMILSIHAFISFIRMTCVLSMRFK